MVKPVGCGKLAPHPPPLSPRSAYVVPCVRRRAGTPRAAQYPLRVGHESPQTTEEGDLLLGKGSVLLVGRVILFPRRRRSRERFGGARASDLGVTSTGSPDMPGLPHDPADHPPEGCSGRSRAPGAGSEGPRPGGSATRRSGHCSRIDSRTLSRNDQPRSIPFDKIRRVDGHTSFAFRALVRGWLKVRDAVLSLIFPSRSGNHARLPPRPGSA